VGEGVVESVVEEIVVAETVWLCVEM